MSTSGTKSSKRKRFRAPIVYCCVAAFCFVIARLYGLFGHGVRSPAMDYMFLYPLIGGGIVLIAALIKPLLTAKARKGSRAAFNLYSSAIACLTVASCLQGVVEIAGTGTVWVLWFRLAAIVFFCGMFAVYSI